MSVPCVLTGDLIASTAAAPAQVDAAMQALSRISGVWPDADLRFTRFRGDGWQVLVPVAGDALRVALMLSAGLQAAQTGLSTRIALGFGNITATGTRNLGDGMGTAFVRSGRALDAMPRSLLWEARGGQHLPAWVTGYVHLAAWLATRWTAGQAAVVAPYLLAPNARQEDHAAQLGLTRQAWKSRLDGSGIVAWQAALTAFQAWNGKGITDD